MPPREQTRTLTSLRLRTDTLTTLQAVSSLIGVSQSRLVEQALEPLLDQEIRRRKIGRLVRLVKAERAKRTEE